MRDPFSSIRRVLSPGAASVILLALVSSILVWRIKPADRDGMLFWVFASTHYETYLNTLPKWNQDNPDKKVQMRILNGQVLERRMVSGFFPARRWQMFLKSSADLRLGRLRDR